MNTNNALPKQFNDGDVHIWRADLDRLGAECPHLENHLDSLEQQRATQFLRPLDRARFTVGRAYLREILSRCIGFPPAELVIAYNPHGKPFLPDHREWHFNVSHSQNLALFAVSYDREIGVDIERIRPEISPPPSALCEREQRELNQAEDKVATSLHFWTRKEAFLKANGCGVSLPLSWIDVSAEGGEVSLYDPRTKNWKLSGAWSARSMDSLPGCMAAVAARGRDWAVVTHHEA